MHVIEARNVNEALHNGLGYIEQYGVEMYSRNGPVITIPEPVTMVYDLPRERVLFSPERDANPFFHLFESVWMLAGRNAVKDVSRFAKQIKQYSDDGKSLWGAYGYRWRHHFNFDQIDAVILDLKTNPESRRAVISMWDGLTDLRVAAAGGKDVPCNTQVFFRVAPSGELNMTVTNRSNDLLWGMTGANAVHFSFLQEFVANALNRPVGRYWQVSNNLHVYTEFGPYEKLKELFGSEHGSGVYDFYDPHSAALHNVNPVSPGPEVLAACSPVEFQQDCMMIFDTDGQVYGLRDRFLRKVVKPLWHAYISYERRNQDKGAFRAAHDNVGQCIASDWSTACHQWLDRREAAREKAQDSGVANVA